MNLDINSLNPNRLTPVEPAKAEKKTGEVEPQTSTADPETSSKESTVHFTETAELLRSLTASAQHVPEVNAERVAEIKQAIAKGEYLIDPDTIAEKILAEEAGYKEKGE